MIVDLFGCPFEVGHQVVINPRILLGDAETWLQAKVSEVHEIVIDTPKGAPEMKIVRFLAKLQAAVPAINPRVVGAVVSAAQPNPDKEGGKDGKIHLA